LAMTSEERAARTAELALTKKAENVISLDLRGLTSACDFFIICNGTSDVQVKAIADAIRDGMTEVGERPWHIEGYQGRRWILLDYVDIVVHVFDEDTRDYYQLEMLWGDAKTRKFEDEPTAAPTGGGDSDD
jgi:ribosome-associated protein